MHICVESRNSCVPSGEKMMKIMDTHNDDGHWDISHCIVSSSKQNKEVHSYLMMYRKQD